MFERFADDRVKAAVRIIFAAPIELGVESAFLYYFSKLRAVVGGIVVKTRLGRRHIAKQHAEIRFKHILIKIAGHAVELIEVVELVAEYIFNAALRKRLRNGAVYRDAAHRTHVYPTRKGFFVAYDKSLSFGKFFLKPLYDVIRNPVCPKHIV